jgi:hypothetical protein
MGASDYSLSRLLYAPFIGGNDCRGTTVMLVFAVRK